LYIISLQVIEANEVFIDIYALNTTLYHKPEKSTIQIR